MQTVCTPLPFFVLNIECRKPNHAELRYRIPQVVQGELPSATNWRAFIYFFVKGLSSMFTEMIIKI